MTPYPTMQQPDPETAVAWRATSSYTAPSNAFDRRFFICCRGKEVDGKMANRLKYKTPEKMQEAIDAYFKECEGHPLLDDEGQPFTDKYGNPFIVDRKPLTVTGLALALGFATRQSLLDYEGKGQFKFIIQQAKLRIENYAEMRLYDKEGANGAKFNLQNNFKRWDADKPGSDDKKAPAVNIICDIPRVTARVAEDQDGITIDPEAVDKAIKELEGKASEG